MELNKMEQKGEELLQPQLSGNRSACLTGAEKEHTLFIISRWRSALPNYDFFSYAEEQEGRVRASLLPLLSNNVKPSYGPTLSSIVEPYSSGAPSM